MVEIKETRELKEFPARRGPYKYADIYREIDAAKMGVPTELNLGDATLDNVRAICSRYYGKKRAEMNGFWLRTRSYKRGKDRMFTFVKLESPE